MILLICPYARVLLFTFVVCLHKINLLKCRDRIGDISGDNSETKQKKNERKNEPDQTADRT